VETFEHCWVPDCEAASAGQGAIALSDGGEMPPGMPWKQTTAR
jgi:hypothetical protein